MIRPHPSRSHWRRSSYCADVDEQCVEFRPVPHRRIAVRDSKARPRGACTFASGAWAAFVRAVREPHGLS
ncbi:DUF397 domain-containing protein [Streptomyces huiliensis]|uniref:DUF397 domain-containing protein n=1 Tax=Streptomyces huiliensis TaxID=2876027 RepID=UPI001CBEE37C|nr:DUF397 domain-containing protein [Streptomyces huiliensis]MBZ4319273.1 DUF397 domain-containing protein [Streptomyces huiliensis]